MRLLEALKFGESKGFKTVGGCLECIRVNSDKMFSPADCQDNLIDIYVDLKALKFCTDVSESSGISKAIKVLEDDSVRVCISVYRMVLEDYSND